MKRPILAALAACLFAATAAASPPLTLERLFADPPLAGSLPRALAIAPDGRHIAWLQPRADDQLRHDLWIEEVASGRQRMAVDSLALSSRPAQLSEAELMRRERARLAGSRGIVEYQWSPDGRTLLVPLDGDIWLAPLDGAPRRLTDTPATEIDARLSPQGRYVSFVREQNLHVIDLTSGRERALTTAGGGALSFGVAEFVAQEEMDRMTGQWWSPDDRLIAVARVDETPVRIAIRAAIGSDGTSLSEQRYPFAGTANALVSLAIHRPGGGRPVAVDLGDEPDIYLARVHWLTPARLIVARQSRDQQRLDLLLVEAATGRTTLLLTETSPTWIDLPDSFAPLNGGQAFLWASARSGYRHLYRVTLDGDMTPVTQGTWDVDELLGVDEDGGHLLFTGFADTVLEKALYRAPLDGSAPPQRLTPAGGWAEAVADSQGRAALVTRSTPAQPPQLLLLDPASGTQRAIRENRLADTPYAAYAAGHVAPRFGTLPAADGETPLHYMLLVPPGLQPGERAPVFFEVYGGPGVTRVQRGWTSQTLRHQYLLDQGYVVFQVDNRGTPHRGRAFADPLYRQIGAVDTADQMAALGWLKQQPFVDPGRVAVYGWSYGGYMALRLLTEHPGAFAAGVAGAPVTDWTLYDTHYTERYLGNPQADITPYRASDVTHQADRLADPLLIIHGLADDNVVFDHSARMMAALQQAGKPFATMVYPGQTHSIRDPGLQQHLWSGITRFLDQSMPRE